MSGHPPSLDSGRHPFELFVLVLCLLAGVPLVLGSPAPGSTAALLSPGLARLWGVMLAGGSLVALIGVWWTWWGWMGRWWSRLHPDPGTGLLMEQVGLVAVAAGMVTYTAGLLTADVPLDNKRISLALGVALGLAALWRVGQIQAWIRAAVRAAREH